VPLNLEFFKSGKNIQHFYYEILRRLKVEPVQTNTTNAFLAVSLEPIKVTLNKHKKWHD